MKNRIARDLMLGLMILLAPASLLSAATIWGGEEDPYGTPLAKKLKPGDIVTVVITEESTATSKAGTNTQKQAQSKVEIAAGTTGTTGRNFFQGNLPNADLQAQNDNKAEGTTTRSGKLSAVITTRIEQVLPNGNYLLRGQRRIRINKETQLITISGVARPKDITENNNISSTLLSDAEIKYEGKGPVGGTTRPGIINKVMNWLF